MLTACTRALVALALAICAAPPVTAAPPAAPTREQIARWVRQLGAEDFAVREEATKRLSAAGEAAEGALEAAVKSDDPEVARRARELLAAFRWGIYPDTPKAVVDLIARYQTGDRNTKGEVIRQLLDKGTPGCKALLKIARAEDDGPWRQELLARIANEVPRLVPVLLEENNHATLEALLDLGLRQGVRLGVAHCAAYWLLRGKLDDRIAHYNALVARSTDDNDRKEKLEVLAYLYRARGDRSAARQAAAKADLPDFVEGLLYEAAGWKELAGRPHPAAGHNRLEALGFRAAYNRLAGNTKEFEDALAEVRTLVKGLEGDRAQDQLFSCAKIFFLNDRPAEALDLLARTPRQKMRFEVLASQMKYREAFGLVDQARSGANKNLLPALEILEARTLYTLGETARAGAIFARYGDQIGDVKDGRAPSDFSWFEDLVDAEYRVGLKDQAYEHAARILATSRDQGWPGRLFPRVFPGKGETAEVWWHLLRKQFPERQHARTMKMLREVLEGKTDVKVLTAMIKKAELTDKELRDEDADRLRRALAEAALAAKQEPLARACLEKATTPKALIRLGDLLAERKDWERAAERYHQAWEKDRHDPLPLYLSGWALGKTGREKEGKRRTEQAHWLPLGDEAARAAFALALARRGHAEDGRRENDLVLRVSRPGSFYAGEALYRLGLDGAARKDWFKVARANELGMLRCLHPTVSFVQPTGYLRLPAIVHAQRARGYLAAGELQEARREMALCQAAVPGTTDLPILLVPELEKRGRKKEADEVYKEAAAVFDRLCRDYPRCSWAHNQAAWLSACCRRDLDKALEHGRKAVELAPDNGSHWDTLAEVYFQRGDKEKAIPAQKKAIELNPKKTYFRRQLQRIEAGDPKAERPPEGDE